MLEEEVGDILEGSRRIPVKPSIVSPFVKTETDNKKGKPKEQVARPPGMSKEVYGLIRGSDHETKAEVMSSIMPCCRRGYKKEKAKIGMSAGRKYHWVPFVNEARTDGLQLFHWMPQDQLELKKPYIFAQFNQVVNCPTYSDEQYHQLLRVEDWTKEETDHLLDICRRFDRRWPIVYDRFDRTKFPKPRSVEDLKERFYFVVSALHPIEDTNTPEYDAEHERLRKEQLEKQWKLTKADMEEQKALRRQQKQIDAKKRERKVLASEYVRNHCVLQKASSRRETAAFKAPKILKKVAGRVKVGADAGPLVHKQLEEFAGKEFRVPGYKAIGCHIRSQEIIQVKCYAGSIRREKNIKYIMAMRQMHIRYSPGTPEIVAVYNAFKKNVVILELLKANLAAAEQELRELLAPKKSEEEMDALIPPCVAISSLPQSGQLESQVNGKEGAPATLRRLAAVVDKTDVRLDKNGVPIIPGYLINTPSL